MGYMNGLNRQEHLRCMKEDVLDVIVIGGGITGAGIAWDASLRGMRVGLLEMRDFASGTSSRSTKLIHGGLRYLKQGEVRLVKEVGRERTLLYNKMPHLVIPAPMLLPIYKNGQMGYFTSSLGLYIYDWLAGVTLHERRKMLSREEVLHMEPLLNTLGLKGAGYYFEYRTDDARLTIEIIKSAAAVGAMVANYTKVIDFLYHEGVCAGVVAQDELSGKVFTIYAKKVVNAAGPWVDRIRKTDGSLTGKKLFLTKGVHLVFERKRLPVEHSIYFDTPDGRMIFVIPRGQVTYAGTTDTAYSSSLEEPRTTVADRDYLLQAVNRVFPSLQLKPLDVISNWAGLRPLIYEEGKGPSELSRRDELIVSASGLITIAGGKLTGFRKMAEKVVNLIAKLLAEEEGRVFQVCTTHQAKISGGESVDRFQEKQAIWLREGTARGLEIPAIEELYSLYGANIMEFFQIFDESEVSNSEQLVDEIGEKRLHSEIMYAIQFEMAQTAVDFLVRRTGLVYFNPVKAEKIAPTVVKVMGDSFNWSLEERLRQFKLLQSEILSLRDLPSTDG